VPEGARGRMKEKMQQRRKKNKPGRGFSLLRDILRGEKKRKNSEHKKISEKRQHRDRREGEKINGV
jgi:hypothetical protein